MTMTTSPSSSTTVQASVNAEMTDATQSLMEQEQEKSPVKPGKRKRHITERRRMQGRAAQKRFREKQKAYQTAGSGETNLICDTYKCKAATVSAVPVDAFEATIRPINLLDVPLTDELLGGFNLNSQSQSCDTSFDNMDILQPITTGTGSSLNGLLGPAMPDTYGEPGGAFEDSRSVSLSIPMDSYIRVQRYSFHAACIENAFILGVTLVQLKDHKCGHDRLVSPWLSRHVDTTLNEHSVVPDLSPSEGQKKHNHDLYIDCLPFKDFREKLLALRSVEPKIFDEEDFIKDLDYRDAMQCWGPTPWEDKSWEVQLWFLRKWWMITGGENGNMGTSSRWWRMLRGE